MHLAELKNYERELQNFRLRMVIAAAVALLAFGLLLARFVYLQVLQHDYYQTKAEDNRISIVPVAPNRGLIVDRNGVVLAGNDSGYTLEIAPDKTPDLARTIDRLSRLVEIQPKDRTRFERLLRRDAQRREPADPHPAHRGRGGEGRRQPLPFSGRRDQGAPVPRLSARRDRFARARLHRQDHRAGPGKDRGARPRRRTTAAPTSSARAESRQATRRTCTAAPASSRSRSTPPGAPSGR